MLRHTRLNDEHFLSEKSDLLTSPKKITCKISKKKMFWGFSDALDLYGEYIEIVSPSDLPKTLNILLIGSSDPRHIIKSIAKSFHHDATINFYVIEGCPALIARHMLLTIVSLEPSESMSLQGKTQLFMDLFGNTLLRASSAGYLSSKANHLINFITESNEQMLPIFNVSQLKYLERDMLVKIFSFWREKDGNRFDIDAHWKRRLVQLLGQRYDTRTGAFDWDLQMRLKENGASQICSQEYRHWRETGVAFTFPEFRQSHPNKTLALETSNRNDRMYGGYAGDIEIGPFCTFGLKCADERMLRSNYGQNEFRATDITERNLFELFYEIEHRQPYPADEYNVHKLGSTIVDMGKAFKYTPNASNDMELKQFNKKLLNVDGRINVVYLSINDAEAILDGTKTTQNYDLVFVGRKYFPLLQANFASLLAKPMAAVLFETAQPSVERRPETTAFLMKIRQLAKESNLNAVSNFNINLPLTIAKFKTTR